MIPFLITRNSSRGRQPLSRVNVSGLLRQLQVKIENIYLFKMIKKSMEMSLKTGFAQIFSFWPKNLSCPKFGGGSADPLVPPARTPMRVAWNLAVPVFISPIVWNMCENLHYKSVYFKELHNQQEYYRPTIYRTGPAVVSTITSI